MFALTFDADWAPDFVLEYVDKILTEQKVKATWFITNESPYLEKLKQNSLFELGIHPNFASNSTQGNDPSSILENLKKIIPNAKSARTHALLQSTQLLSKFQDYGIENDVSLFLPKTKNLIPHYSKYLNLYRFPFFWEDDFYMADEDKWSVNQEFIDIPGLKIFNFHPIHIFLNSKNMSNYELMKKEIGLPQINKKNIEKFFNKTEAGTRTFFDEFILFLRNQETYTIQDLRKIFKKDMEGSI